MRLLSADELPSFVAVIVDPKYIKKEDAMAKPNFQFQKRQKELEKKKKNEEKLQRKLERSSAPEGQEEEQPEEEGEAVDEAP